MYDLHFASTFAPTYKALIKNNQELEKRTKKALRLLKNDPLYPSLKSHKVNTRNFGQKWSSWITSDLRVIWDFDEERKLVILLFAITRHSGSHREYK
ncbi:type II toxin-antitoxin system mRNA interferase toxin, RelE/StbE family [Candidatus Gottesmanbacteria bacterium]|nr:type II toxin-antitoxin system mRNA interferase toxin, RelE/StbE family [Candidatus Gottesmanbacteria bacterium]MBI3443404.1 type II toxin-antitoxin system mRNA interferase toxin, RelE/StbE family [Candidatus Woesebacteria bacterium]